jgi:MFS transporter, Spinster family, sphingosine-1-phosphate transporter
MTEPPATRSGPYKHYLLLVLTLILLFNYVDRMALGIVLQDIKADLDLSDTQLGVLSGIAFALFYSVMGIPIARWADRGDRVMIIAVTAVLWSVAVALCAVAESFAQLLLIRVLVAVGEAGCVPPAFSLIADYFTRSERPRASAIYGAGGTLSVVVGYFIAGWLNELYGWRMTFVLMSAPGLLLGVVAWFSLREPRREGALARKARAESAAVSSVTSPSLREVCVTLWTNVTFRHLLFCLSVLFFFNVGIGQWLPTFFIRSFGLETGEIGTWLAVIYCGGGLIGAYLGGELATRYAANNERLQLNAMAIAMALSGVVMMFVCLSSQSFWAFALMGLVAIGITTVNGPLFATIQTLVPESMRALSFALVYLFANLIGMGFGPLATGVLSDAFRPWAGEESLRYALLALSPGYFFVAWYARQAATTVMRDLAVAQANEDAVAVRREPLSSTWA